jgi:hypothetical protein
VVMDAPADPSSVVDVVDVVPEDELSVDCRVSSADEELVDVAWVVAVSVPIEPRALIAAKASTKELRAVAVTCRRIARIRRARARRRSRALSMRRGSVMATSVGPVHERALSGG